MEMSNPRLGIDIGRVIIDGSSHPEGGDTAFFQGDTATMLRTPAMSRAFEVIPRLVELFDNQVWLVSKCGPRVQSRTELWLRHHRFYERTGIAPEAVRFCRNRPDKAIHCRQLGLTHFIDDHPEVHAAIREAVEYRYLFGPSRKVPAGTTHTPTWPDVEQAVRRDLGHSSS